jgi:hypothetical protein
MATRRNVIKPVQTSATIGGGHLASAAHRVGARSPVLSRQAGPAVSRVGDPERAAVDAGQRPGCRNAADDGVAGGRSSKWIGPAGSQP